MHIQVPDDLVAKLQQKGISDIEELVKRLIQQMDDTDLMPTKQPGELVSEDVNKRVRELVDGFAQMRQGLSQDELDELVALINEEYIDPDLLTPPDNQPAG